MLIAADSLVQGGAITRPLGPVRPRLWLFRPVHPNLSGECGLADSRAVTRASRVAYSPRLILRCSNGFPRPIPCKLVSPIENWGAVSAP